MKVDPSKSAYHEAESARQDFTKTELRRLRLLLRRLRFLEAQGAADDGSAVDGSGGAQFREWEVEALEWVLAEVGFLPEIEGFTVSGNGGA